MSYPLRPPPSPELIATPPTDLIEAAGSGNEAAFAKLIDPFRGELHAHCYRMLGSVHDAEDALQEALLRAWRGLARFEGRSSLRSWLYTIATNTCLNHIERRPKRVLPIDYGPATDPHGQGDGLGLPPLESVWVEPYPDQGLGLEDGYAGPEARYELRESVELALVAALQNLPSNQRAALILREVLGFSANEAAEALETSVASVNSALQRARKTIDDKLPEESQQATLRSLGDDKVREIVEGYMEKMSSGDVDGMVQMLAEDAAWSMPPLPGWFTGENLRGFLEVGPLSGEWRWRHLPTWANGQPAVASYAWYEPDQAYRLFALDTLSLRPDGRIGAITSFITRSTMSREELFYQRYPEQPRDESNVSVEAERFGVPEYLPD